jgi:hypothetical protein
VTVFDSTGARRSDSPMNYAFGRHTLELTADDAGNTLTIELFPAFAHLEPPESWTAEVRIRYVATEPVALPALGSSTVAELEVAPSESRAVQFGPVPLEFELPEGYAPLVEVSSQPAKGPAAVRRGAAER